MIENVMSRLHMDGGGGCEAEPGGAPVAPSPPAAKPSPPSPRSIKAKYARELRGGAGGGGKPAAAGSPRARARRMSSALDYSALALPGVASNVHRTADDVIQLLSTLLVPGEEEEAGAPGGGGCSPSSLAPPRLARPRASVDLGSFCKGRGGGGGGGGSGSGARSPRRMRGASEADVLHYERRYGYGGAAERHAESPLLVSTEVSATEDEDASDMELVVQSARAQLAAPPAAPAAAAASPAAAARPRYRCCSVS